MLTLLISLKAVWSSQSLELRVEKGYLELAAAQGTCGIWILSVVRLKQFSPQPILDKALSSRHLGGQLGIDCLSRFPQLKGVRVCLYYGMSLLGALNGECRKLGRYLVHVEGWSSLLNGYKVAYLPNRVGSSCSDLWLGGGFTAVMWLDLQRRRILSSQKILILFVRT